MLRPNPPGRPPLLDEALKNKIIEASGVIIVQNHVAGKCGIAKSTLSDWLSRGLEDVRLGNDTLFAQLSNGVRKAHAEIVGEIVTDLRTCPRNYGALTFLLEKCFKDDFEVKSEAHKQLEDYVLNIIQPMMSKGGLEHGRQETKEIEQGCINTLLESGTGKP